jgi:hypothetical protein
MNEPSRTQFIPPAINRIRPVREVVMNRDRLTNYEIDRMFDEFAGRAIEENVTPEGLLLDVFDLASEYLDDSEIIDALYEPLDEEYRK